MLNAAQAREPFHLLCKPIGPKCNLKCDYCFYLMKEDLFADHETLNDFKMTDEVLETYVKQYIQAQNPNAAEVNFAWQGGEPTLLGIEFFQKAIDLQNTHKRPSQKVTNAFQTNGVLLNDDWGRFLHDNEFLVGISIEIVCVNVS